MHHALLKTKLFVPPARRAIVPRTRLVDALAEGVDGKLTLVSAPAGFGKTTAVSLWVAGRGRVAWLSLDDGDNDIRRFLTYLVAAVQTVEARFAQGVETLLSANRLPDAETIVALLTEEMYDSEPFLLILDDYQTIQNPALHALVETLLAYQPPSLHLVLITREDPPLPLNRLRARDNLNEIRAQDLRFTEAEARAFLNEAMVLELTDKQVHTLEARTEGWIAGLQLAGLSLQNSPDRASFVAAFAGDDRYILDYLMDEVFARQPPDVQRFLLHTSILERLAADLCEAVVNGAEEGHAQAMLEELEASNLFIVPLDNRREWYRYHHLFADLLRFRLARQQPDLIPALHRRASAWYEEAGELHAAVEHALAAGDEARVAALIETHAAALFGASEMEAIMDWIGKLPHALMAERPTLLMIHAWAALSTGFPERTEGSLAQIEAILEADGKAPALAGTTVQAVRAEIAVTRAVLAYGRGDARQTVALVQSVLPALTESAPYGLFHAPMNLRSVAFNALGTAHQMEGNVVAAEAAFAEAVTISEEQGNPHIVALATGSLGQLHVLQGRLRKAERVYRQALARAEAAGGEQTPFRSMAHAGLGNLFYEWNDLEATDRHLARAITLARPLGNWESLLPAYTGRARLRQAQGKAQAALDTLDDLVTLRRRFGATDRLPALDALRATLHLRQGNVAAAARWSDEVTLPEGDIPFAREGEAIAQARILLAQEQTRPAGALLDKLLAQAEADGRYGTTVGLLLLQALALDAQGRRERAVMVVEKALLLARPGGYVRTFLDEGQSLVPLLYAVDAQGGAAAYAGRLLSVFVPDGAAAGEGEQRPGRGQRGQREQMVEQLTQREVEVLQQVAAGLTNREIAQALSIALGTVKVHTYNIYGKLGVNNRIEAVSRGRALGILAGE